MTMYRDFLEALRQQKKQPIPASEADVAIFERDNKIQLPSEFRKYLLEAGGTTIDTDTFCFYGIHQLRLWANEDPPIPSFAHAQTDPTHYIIFADYLQWCYAYAIRVVGPKDRIGEVIHAGMLKPSAICETFCSFVDLYLVDDMRLHIVNEL
jgi:SMI1 / KNR4 family (SUKH-1)